MAPQEQAASAEANNTTSSTSAPEGQEQQGQQAPTSAPEGNGEQQASTLKEPITLPDDHPLVVRLNKLKESDAAQRSELQELRAKSAQVTKLEAERDARPTKEALDTLQTRYDRLEAFAQAVGIGKALDSRTFTRDLFESDKDIAQLVKDWNKANPTATSQALASTSGGGEGKAKHDPNELLRIAAGKQ